MLLGLCACCWTGRTGDRDGHALLPSPVSPYPPHTCNTPSSPLSQAVVSSGCYRLSLFLLLLPRSVITIFYGWMDRDRMISLLWHLPGMHWPSACIHGFTQPGTQQQQLLHSSSSLLLLPQIVLSLSSLSLPLSGGQGERRRRRRLLHTCLLPPRTRV